MNAVTLERLQEVLHYDPLTGDFTQKVRTSNRGAKVGGVAGSRNDQGYILIGIDGVQYRAHRLAWLFMTGAWPDGPIDHRDTDHANNRFANLRQANVQLNNENRRRARKDSTTGLLGVRKKRGVTYVARIATHGKSKYIGTFATPELAHAAYVAAKRFHHPGNTL